MNNSLGSTACFILMYSNSASVLVNKFLLHKAENLWRLLGLILVIVQFSIGPLQSPTAKQQ